MMMMVVKMTEIDRKLLLEVIFVISLSLLLYCVFLTPQGSKMADRSEARNHRYFDEKLCFAMFAHLRSAILSKIKENNLLISYPA